MDKFVYINIREYLVYDNSSEIGEADLKTAVSDFLCNKNFVSNDISISVH